MLGIFDSGKGALAVLSQVRDLYPLADICVLQDSENAPYGTKCEDELTAIVKRNISRLVCAGASRVLIGCCTAATVFSRLGRIERQLSVPIIYPTALAAVRATRSKRIGVIATVATVKAHAFRREILALDPMCLVTEKAAQELVGMVESGEEDPLIIGGILEEFRTSDIDTLILGCTHFPYLASAIGSLMPEVTLVSCARAAAESISPLRSEMGRTLVLLPNGDTEPLTQ